MNKEKIKIGLLGLGTVGMGVYQVLDMQKSEFLQKVGTEIEIGKILVKNIHKERKGIDFCLLTDKWEEILADDSIQIVVEVMGGIEPARTYILQALAAGKHVVTANKDLLAEYGKELLDTAEKKNCDLLFEAAVAGGIPIIRPLKQCLAGNHITEIMGIVNGTTNYILTKMTQEGMEFDEALEKAEKMGYAEADPTADIEGYDAGRKIAIMASIAFNSRVTFSDVYTEGITGISAKDIRYAKEMGCHIKLLGVAGITKEGIEVRVHPMLIPSTHPLSSVNDTFNAIFLHGDAVDDAMFYGRGAGQLPTASAVVGDIIEVVRDYRFACNGRLGCTCYKELPVKPMSEIESRYFIRMEVEDRPGVLAGISSVLGNNMVSIAQVIQKPGKKGAAELVVITDKVRERNFRDSLTIVEGFSMVKKVSSVIRVYSER